MSDTELDDEDRYYNNLKPPRIIEKHMHHAKYDEDGNLTDDCLHCGESFRNTDVHITDRL